MQRSLLLFQQVEERRQKVLRRGNGNHWSRSRLLLRVGSNHSQALESSLSGQFIGHPIGKYSEVSVEDLLTENGVGRANQRRGSQEAAMFDFSVNVDAAKFLHDYII